MTQDELLEIAHRQKPHIKYAPNFKGTAIGAWTIPQGETAGRYVIVAGKAITGEWMQMPYGLLVNGKALHEPSDWDESRAIGGLHSTEAKPLATL